MIEVATGGNPEAALERAFAKLPLHPGEFWVVNAEHDDGCPCTRQGSAIRDCTCEIVWLSAERVM